MDRYGLNAATLLRQFLAVVAPSSRVAPTVQTGGSIDENIRRARASGQAIAWGLSSALIVIDVAVAVWPSASLGACGQSPGRK
jgi:hypothetical protein